MLLGELAAMTCAEPDLRSAQPVTSKASATQAISDRNVELMGGMRIFDGLSQIRTATPSLIEFNSGGEE